MGETHVIFQLSPREDHEAVAPPGGGGGSSERIIILGAWPWEKRGVMMCVGEGCMEGAEECGVENVRAIEIDIF